MIDIKIMNDLLGKFGEVLSSWLEDNAMKLKGISSDDLHDCVTDNIVEVISEEITSFVMEKGGE